MPYSARPLLAGRVLAGAQNQPNERRFTLEPRRSYRGKWLIRFALLLGIGALLLVRVGQALGAESQAASIPKTPAFHVFETRACQLLGSQNQEAALSLSGFYELLYRAHSTEDPVELHKALVGAGKDWKAVTDVAAKYNRLLFKAKPPTEYEKRLWASRFRVELSVIKISRRQQAALSQADLAAYDALQPRLENREHAQQRLFDRLNIACG